MIAKRMVRRENSLLQKKTGLRRNTMQFGSVSKIILMIFNFFFLNLIYCFPQLDRIGRFVRWKNWLLIEIYCVFFFFTLLSNLSGLNIEYFFFFDVFQPGSGWVSRALARRFRRGSQIVHAVINRACLWVPLSATTGHSPGEPNRDDRKRTMSTINHSIVPIHIVAVPQ